ncbi:hypothetical protein JCM10213_002793 [Rhodosporidiobolus nylandii]
MVAFSLVLLASLSSSIVLGYSSSASSTGPSCSKSRKHVKPFGKQNHKSWAWSSSFAVDWQDLASDATGEHGGKGAAAGTLSLPSSVHHGGRDGTSVATAAPVAGDNKGKGLWATSWATTWTSGYGEAPATVAAHTQATSWATSWTSVAKAPQKTGSSGKTKGGSSGSSGSSGSASNGGSSSSGSSAGGGSSVQSLALDAHNTLRAKHDASPLAWSTELADAATSWVNKCVYQHGGGEALKAGENIAMTTAKMNFVAGGIKMWADEASLYNSSKPGYSEQAGHFTQMVWKDTTHVGCAETFCDGLGTFLACEYLPAGNNVGWDAASATKFFRANVQA